MTRPTFAALALATWLAALAPAAWLAGSTEATAQTTTARTSTPARTLTLAETERPTILIASGAPASAGNAVASALCGGLNEGEALWCAVAPTRTVDGTLDAVLSGRTDFALMRSDTVRARGDGIRVIGALYDDVATVIGRAGAAGGFASLLGGRVNAGAPGTVPRALWDALEAAALPDGASFALRSELRAVEAGQAFCSGRIDGFLWLLTHPSGALRDLVGRCGARPLDVRGPGVEALILSRPDLRPVTVEGRDYGIGEAASVGLPVLLVAGPSATDAAVAALTDAVLTNIDAISAAHPAMARLNTENIVFAKLDRPVHPAAWEVYRAFGLTN